MNRHTSTLYHPILLIFMTYSPCQMKKKGINTLGLLDVKRVLSIGENIYWSSSLAINLKANAESLTKSLLVPHIPYRLDENRIILVLDGHLQFRLDLIEYNARSGDIAFIPQGSVVEIEMVSSDYTCQMITFAETPDGDAANEIDKPLILQNHHTASIYCSGLINSIFSIISSENGHPRSSKMVLHALVEYIKECALAHPAEESNTPRRAEQIHNRFLRLVQDNYATHRDAAWYADKLCISRHYLHNCISTASGKSVQQWISLAVIQQARYLLKYTDLPVYEIASQLGFSSHAFFTRYFKQKTATTPEAYRRE